MGFSFSIGNLLRADRGFQAVEFPLPDEEGEIKLTTLYARALQVPDDLLELTVRGTKAR